MAINLGKHVTHRHQGSLKEICCSIFHTTYSLKEWVPQLHRDENIVSHYLQCFERGPKRLSVYSVDTKGIVINANKNPEIWMFWSCLHS